MAKSRTARPSPRYCGSTAFAKPTRDAGVKWVRQGNPMGWEDRPYYRDRGGDVRNPLMFLFFGSIPLFTAFGIRVRAHMSLILFIGLTLLIGGLGTKNYDWEQRLE